MCDLQDRFPFVDLANAEHRRVRSIIGLLEQAMRFGVQERAEGFQQTKVVGNLLGDLADELRRHFMKEQEGGLLEEAACRIPALARRVAPVLAAWPAMIARVEALQEMVHRYAEESRVSTTLAAMIHRAALDVISLESTEDQILSSAFGVNLDSSGPPQECV